MEVINMKKLAMPLLDDNGKDSVISEHFGHAPYFGYITLKDEGYDIDIQKNPLSEHAPGQIPGLMKENNVDVMVVRGIGSRAVEFFNQFDIEVYRGVSGNLKQIMEDYLSNNLEDDETYGCNHDHHH
jgi:predicted Fe-Mo cluster-binding NifX family protein